MDLKKIQTQGICYHAEAGGYCPQPEHRIDPAEMAPHTCAKGMLMMLKMPRKDFRVSRRVVGLNGWRQEHR